MMGHEGSDLLLDPFLGKTLDGKYRVEALIGRGGMGAVYRATDLALEREVAVKVVHAPDAEAASRFRLEARAVARLKHPNIVMVFDSGTAPGLGAYIVMEYLAGRSLRDELVARRRLTPAEAVAVARGVLAGVRAAHRAGVIHRDLKPENVFLETSPDGRVARIVDFGIAKLVEPDAPAGPFATAAGGVIGTPVYIAPERWRGEPADERTDLYSVGCLLYETLTGRPPFVPDGRTPLSQMHLRQEPAPPSRLAPGLPASLDRVVLRALAKEPDLRYQSAEAFERDLASWELRPEGYTGETLQLATVPTGAARAGLPPNNLPHRTTRFVGRRGQIAEIQALLGTTRLLTLTGPGGIGKTRLSIEIGSTVLVDYPGGVWLVRLAPVASDERVADAILSALGQGEEPGLSVLESLERGIGDRELLLLLDNCEHVVAACAEAADRLLRACPNLRVLATSREPLAVAGETIWAVPPLAVPAEGPTPTREEMAESEAVALFLDRAAAARPGYALDERTVEPLARLVRALDGIPLAIELAAARVRALTVEQIVERLDGLFDLLRGGSRTAMPHHQTLEAAIDWSHRMLSDGERALFRRLSVFAGGWSLEAAEAVCPDGEVEWRDVLDLLVRLVDRSLVVVAERGGVARYRLLEPIRRYAAQRLAEAGEASAVRAAHRAWFLRLAEEAHGELHGARQTEWLSRLDADRSNLAAALEWPAPAGDAADTAESAPLCLALSRFWAFRGYWSEARRHLERLLAAPGDALGDADRARALYWLGHFLRLQGALREALEAAGRSLALRRRLDDATEVSRSLHLVADVRLRLGDVDGAIASARECLALARETGSPTDVGAAANLLGQIGLHAGDYEEARAQFEAALEVFRETGREDAIAGLLLNLGNTAFQGGDVEASRRYLEESLRVQQESGAGRTIEQLTYLSLGDVAHAMGELAAAERHYETSLSTSREIGDLWSVGFGLASLAAVALDGDDDARAAELFEEALAVDPQRTNAEPIALVLEAKARRAAARGDHAEALRAAGAARGLRDAVGLSEARPARERVDRALAEARAALGDEEADRHLEAGRAMSLDEAVALARPAQSRPR